MCKKQTSVSRGSTESEIISLGAGLRMDGLPASWHWRRGDRSVTFIEQYQDTNQSSSRKLFAEPQIPTQTKSETEMFINNDRMWTTSPQTQILLKASLSWYIFEDTEAVIKMIIKRQNSNDETSVKNPQSCTWLVVPQNQFGRQDPNQICGHQKPTCWHVNWRKFHTWWMGPSRSFVEGHEFLDVFLQPFSVKQKAECYVQESSGKCVQRRFGSGEA